MNERLSGILSLAVSRKVIVGLVAGTLAYANVHLSLGLSPDEVKMLIIVAAAIVLGISFEDAAKTIGDAHVEASQNQPPPQVVSQTTTVEEKK